MCDNKQPFSGKVPKKTYSTCAIKTSLCNLEKPGYIEEWEWALRKRTKTHTQKLHKENVNQVIVLQRTTSNTTSSRVPAFFSYFVFQFLPPVFFAAASILLLWYILDIRHSCCIRRIKNIVILWHSRVTGWYRHGGTGIKRWKYSSGIPAAGTDAVDPRAAYAPTYARDELYPIYRDDREKGNILILFRRSFLIIGQFHPTGRCSVVGA